MSGAYGAQTFMPDETQIAKQAVRYTDALLKELEK